MPHVVVEPCIKCKFTDCVDVCPVDCFYEGKDMLVIHPDECIDCGACIPECPVEAITEDDQVPEEWEHYIEFNERMSTIWPSITEVKDPHPESDHHKDVQDKSALRNEDPAD